MCVNVSVLGLYKKSSLGKQNKKQTKKRDTSEAGEGGRRDPQESIMEATRLCSMINEDSVLRNETVPARLCLGEHAHSSGENTGGSVYKEGTSQVRERFLEDASWSNHG